MMLFTQHSYNAYYSCHYLEAGFIYLTGLYSDGLYFRRTHIRQPNFRHEFLSETVFRHFFIQNHFQALYWDTGSSTTGRSDRIGNNW